MTRIEIRADDGVAAEFVRDYVDRRMRPALVRFGTAVVRLSVEVGDTNGSRGGADDKYCRITARLAHCGDVFAESRDADVQIAIDQAVVRIERAVAKTLSRARARDTESVRMPAEEAAGGD